eukprot:scaffold295425_cov32-Tisochrysis_lutea.AAC.3
MAPAARFGGHTCKSRWCSCKCGCTHNANSATAEVVLSRKSVCAKSNASIKTLSPFDPPKRRRSSTTWRVS